MAAAGLEAVAHWSETPMKIPAIKAVLFASFFASAPYALADSTAKPDASTPSSTTAPVAQPETDPAMSNSGKLVPGQPIRPEAQDEASVPKTPMDKSAANSADVGSEKTNTKQNHSSSGADTTNVPKKK